MKVVYVHIAMGLCVLAMLTAVGTLTLGELAIGAEMLRAAGATFLLDEML